MVGVVVSLGEDLAVMVRMCGVAGVYWLGVEVGYRGVSWGVVGRRGLLEEGASGRFLVGSFTVGVYEGVIR